MPPKPKSDKTLEIKEPAPQQKSTGYWLALFLCFAFSVGASSGITYLLLPTKDAAASNDKLTAQDQKIAKLQKTLTEQAAKINAIEAQNETLALYLRHSSATALKNILINQEQNIQAYLQIMKSAMKELSTLSPRITSWNNEYQYQLDLALKGSLEREDLLELLKTGEPNEKAPQ
ncbi:hypothetical protein HGG82_04170 [Marinomonas sp. M1K-6]|uniref:Uncharacterized protein n=1 Tax=Marinomonas profundi TaxID=2726122 RepID=A0A847R086_9GAMM|nr:hypothetical protein [Marinomonas profundi]NLQ16815.1 hypothetical protein [Marinomonas profundi]UDV02548.1 hypothetical protein J8N69_13260 [Marinomonas profundi]